MHLDQRSRVRVREHPDLVLLEICPSTPLSPRGVLGPASGPLDFSPQRYALLREQGYRDAGRVLGELHATLLSVHVRRAAQVEMLDAVRALDDPIVFPD